MQHKDIHQRLADTRDRSWAKSAMGRHSTVADRQPVYPPANVGSSSGTLSLWKRAKWRVRVGRLLIWLGLHLGRQEATPEHQDPVFKQPGRI
ncbi:hypothetical protein HYR54_05315 [Candidatus Acetothermia bacterium]|nr:hypothetical protein [Candidatus Acetothermia bacterium]